MLLKGAKYRVCKMHNALFIHANTDAGAILNIICTAGEVSSSVCKNRIHAQHDN